MHEMQYNSSASLRHLARSLLVRMVPLLASLPSMLLCLCSFGCRQFRSIRADVINGTQHHWSRREMKTERHIDLLARAILVSLGKRNAVLFTYHLTLTANNFFLFFKIICLCYDSLLFSCAFN